MRPVDTLKLMCILALPDDESLSTGCALARCAAEGIETSLVMATRGERGWFGPADEHPGPTALGRMRTAELSGAAQALGLRRVTFLDYLDGDLDQADPAEAIGKIVFQIRRVRPQVVVTFGPDGIYGHPDHIAISQLTTAAITAAADPAYQAAPMAVDLPPHQVAKLYYRVCTEAERAVYEAAFGELVMPVDGVARRWMPWAGWAITTRLDTEGSWPAVWAAIRCHRTQLPNYESLAALPEADHRALWGAQTFYRAVSLVNGGRAMEHDLFAGLR